MISLMTALGLREALCCSVFMRITMAMFAMYAKSEKEILISKHSRKCSKKLQLAIGPWHMSSASLEAHIFLSDMMVCCYKHHYNQCLLL